MVLISWGPSETFILTSSSGAVPISDSWILRVRESEDLDTRKIEGGPGRTVCTYVCKYIIL